MPRVNAEVGLLNDLPFFKRGREGSEKRERSDVMEISAFCFESTFFILIDE